MFLLYYTYNAYSVKKKKRPKLAHTVPKLAFKRCYFGNRLVASKKKFKFFLIVQILNGLEIHVWDVRWAKIYLQKKDRGPLAFTDFYIVCPNKNENLFLKRGIHPKDSFHLFKIFFL